MTDMTRRTILAGGAGLSALTLGDSLLARAARAEDRDDYRALVCVFLHGGMDGHDTLVPLDRKMLADWTKARGGLAKAHAAKGNPRAKGNLLEVGADLTGAPYGLPAAMPNMAAMMRSGHLAVVGNVGPLQGPITPAQLRSGNISHPPKLYSHAHQRDYWRRLTAAGGAQTGWGGRLASAVTPDDPYAAIAASRDEGFAHGLQGPGGTLTALRPRPVWGLRDKLFGSEELAARFSDHFGAAAPGASLLEKDYAARQGDALSLTKRFFDLMRDTDAGETVSARSLQGSLRDNLAIIAKAIALREQTGSNRQVFYVSFGNFDTHQDQAEKLPALQAELDEALGAFTGWLGEESLTQNVTLFTASEFGRTLVPNRTGTDHGWGGHQFVMGGAVNGGRIFGDIPPPATGHPFDAGRGRLIPTLSIEQMAVPLARWLGVPEADIPSVFPYASRFDTRAVPLMKS